MNFKPSKPDARIIIVQIAVAGALSFYFQNQLAIMAFFIVIDVLLCFWFGFKLFFKSFLTYTLLNLLTLIFTVMNIPVVSVIFPAFLMMLTRIYPVYLLLRSLTDRTPMNELLFSLSLMHLPKMILIPLMVIYRYVPTIAQEIRIINESLKMRGLNLSFQNIKHPIRTMENYVVPLFFRSEKLSEELTAAALCKGLSVNRSRTCYTEVKISRNDLLYLLGMIIVTGGLLCLNNLNPDWR